MRKRFSLIFLCLLLITGLVTPAFAEDYVPSVGIREDVAIEGGVQNEDGSSSITVEKADGCREEIILTPYIYIESIESDESKELLEIAYQEIINSNTLDEICPDITKVAEKYDLDVSQLVVRNVFDITQYHRRSDTHDEDLHDPRIEITVDTDILDNFICLLHYNDGEWEIIDDVYVSSDNNTKLYVLLEAFSPFALVVETNEVPKPVIDNGCIIHYIIIIVAAIASALIVVIKKKKIRNIISFIGIVLGIILYFFGSCKLDIIALIIDILAIIIIYYLMNKKKEEDEEEQEQQH